MTNNKAIDGGLSYVWVAEVVMSYQDVAFQPSRARFFPTTFLRHCGRGEGLRTTTCLKLWLGKQGHAPCKVLTLQQGLFLRPLNVMEVIRLLQR